MIEGFQAPRPSNGWGFVPDLFRSVQVAILHPDDVSFCYWGWGCILDPDTTALPFMIAGVVRPSNHFLFL
jgi:hypothetical protein